jgi:hypothetical protein
VWGSGCCAGLLRWCVARWGTGALVAAIGVVDGGGAVFWTVTVPLPQPTRTPSVSPATSTATVVHPGQRNMCAAYTERRWPVDKVDNLFAFPAARSRSGRG